MSLWLTDEVTGLLAKADLHDTAAQHADLRGDLVEAIRQRRVSQVYDDAAEKVIVIRQETGADHG